MTFLVLHADAAATVVSDDPVVPAAQIPRALDALALFEEAGRTRAATAEAVEAARARGHAEGVAAGQAEARETTAKALREELFRLALKDGEERRARQAELARLSLEMVRHIAGEIGPDTLVAGIAQRAAAKLAPETAAVVRVAPGRVDAVRARLGARPYLAVEPDDTLAANDCVVETALGRDHAGLETQLAQIERAWAENRG